MLNQIKALIVILPIVAAVFFVARHAFSTIVDPKQINRWAVFFLLGTVLVFMVPNFWIAIALVTSFSLFAADRRLMPAGICFVFILFLAPPDSQFIPGFGGIQNLFSLSIAKAATISLLVPAMILQKSAINASSRYFGSVDKVFILLVVTVGLLSFRDTTLTNGLRGLFETLLFVLPVFFVISRSISSEQELKTLLVAMAICLVAAAGIAIVEFILQWHFYVDVKQRWGLNTKFEYTSRGGFIRSFASQTEPISFGVFLTIGFYYLCGLISLGVRKRLVQLAMGTVLIAIVFTLSRTPWLVFVCAAAMYVLTGQKVFTQLVKLGAISFVGVIALLMTPFGDTIISLLPGFGNDDVTLDSFNYRQRLFEVAIPVLMDNWISGVPAPELHPEMQVLTQGQGIVDIVNGYLYVALRYGLISFSLFMYVQYATLYQVFRAIGKARRISPALSSMNQAIFAGHFAFLFALSSISYSVGHIATIGWILSAVSLGAARLTAVRVAEASAATPLGSASPSPDLTDSASPVQPGSKPKAGPRKRPNSPAGSLADGGRLVPAHLRQYVRDGEQ